MEFINLEGKSEKEWINILTEEAESIKSTIEVLKDKNLMRQIRESEIDIKEGRVISLEDLIKSNT